jgi:effector-binding domain-containing protein
LAAVRETTTQERLGADIVRLLNLVWPVLRDQGVRTDHNVVVYRGGVDGTLTVDVGVEALTDFEDRGEVRHASTPSGEVATVAYFGEYSGMAPAYAALDRWCQDRGRSPSGVSWEVYGDWDDDPARLRTDIYYLLETAEGSLWMTVQGSSWTRNCSRSC